MGSDDAQGLMVQAASPPDATPVLPRLSTPYEGDAPLTATRTRTDTANRMTAMRRHVSRPSLSRRRIMHADDTNGSVDVFVYTFA